MIVGSVLQITILAPRIVRVVPVIFRKFEHPSPISILASLKLGSGKNG